MKFQEFHYWVRHAKCTWSSSTLQMLAPHHNHKQTHMSCPLSGPTPAIRAFVSLRVPLNLVDLQKIRWKSVA